MRLVTAERSIGGGRKGGRKYRPVPLSTKRGGTLLQEEPVIVFSYVAEADLTTNALSRRYRTLQPYRAPGESRRDRGGHRRQILWNHRIWGGVANAFGRRNPTGVTYQACSSISGRKTTWASGIGAASSSGVSNQSSAWVRLPACMSTDCPRPFDVGKIRAVSRNCCGDDITASHRVASGCRHHRAVCSGATATGRCAGMMCS